MKRELFHLIRPGARVRWTDPAIGNYDPKDRPGQLETIHTVVWVGGDTSPQACCEEDDDIVLIATDNGEAEVWPTELTLVTPAPEAAATVRDPELPTEKTPPCKGGCVHQLKK